MGTLEEDFNEMKSLISQEKTLTETYFDVITGKVKMSREQRDQWNASKEKVLARVKELKALHPELN